MKHLENNKVMNRSNSAYVKPTMEVYEMEVETSILTETASGLQGEEARVNDVNPFGETFKKIKV